MQVTVSTYNKPHSTVLADAQMFAVIAQYCKGIVIAGEKERMLLSCTLVMNSI